MSSAKWQPCARLGVLSICDYVPYDTMALTFSRVPLCSTISIADTNKGLYSNLIIGCNVIYGYIARYCLMRDELDQMGT